jgi:hypothetical protein
MYKIKLKNDLSRAPTWVKRDYKPGEVLDLADNWVSRITDFSWCEILEHYKWITTETKTCETCGSRLMKRTKIIMTGCQLCKHGLVEVKADEKV